MKKSFILGFLVATLLFSVIPVGAAVQQYILTSTTAKMVVDGVEVKDANLPIMAYNGYNYVPAATFRAICDKIGVGFKWDNATKEIQVTTKAVTAVTSAATTSVLSTGGIAVSETTTELLSNITGLTKSDNGEETFVSENTKYITGSSLYALVLNTQKIKLLGNEKSAYIIDLKTNLIVLDNIPFRLYRYDDNHTYLCFEYDYYLNAILPLIK